MNTPKHKPMESTASNYKRALDELTKRRLPMPLQLNDRKNAEHYGVPVLTDKEINTLYNSDEYHYHTSYYEWSFAFDELVFSGECIHFAQDKYGRILLYTK
jgi:hypothetical protein